LIRACTHLDVGDQHVAEALEILATTAADSRSDAPPPSLPTAYA
jgi:hypothetical protein